MKCSLIISFKNSTLRLSLLIESLKQQTEKSFEVIFAHDGYDKDLEAQLNDIKSSLPFDITYLSSGDAAYRREAVLNRAIEVAKSDYLVFIEGGAIPHCHFIEDHLRLSAYGKVVAAQKIEVPAEISSAITEQMIASGKLHSYVKKALFLQMLKGKHSNFQELSRLTNGFLRHLILNDVWEGLSSSNFSIYKEDIMSVNGFDERFDVASEESDFDLELRLLQGGVFTKQERRMATLYEINNEFPRKTSELSSQILEESSNENSSWTPFGIIKGEKPTTEEE